MFDIAGKGHCQAISHKEKYKNKIYKASTVEFFVHSYGFCLLLLVPPRSICCCLKIQPKENMRTLHRGWQTIGTFEAEEMVVRTVRGSPPPPF